MYCSKLHNQKYTVLLYIMRVSQSTCHVHVTLGAVMAFTCIWGQTIAISTFDHQDLLWCWGKCNAKMRFSSMHKHHYISPNHQVTINFVCNPTIFHLIDYDTWPKFKVRATWKCKKCCLTVANQLAYVTGM